MKCYRYSKPLLVQGTLKGGKTYLNIIRCLEFDLKGALGIRYYFLLPKTRCLIVGLLYKQFEYFVKGCE